MKTITSRRVGAAALSALFALSLSACGADSGSSESGTGTTSAAAEGSAPGSSAEDSGTSSSTGSSGDAETARTPEAQATTDSGADQSAEPDEPTSASTSTDSAAPAPASADSASGDCTEGGRSLLVSGVSCEVAQEVARAAGADKSAVVDPHSGAAYQVACQTTDAGGTSRTVCGVVGNGTSGMVTFLN